MRAPAVLPCVPVANEDAVVYSAGCLSFFDCFELFFCGLRCRAGEDLHREGDVFTVRRDEQISHVEGQVGYLLGFAAVDSNLPNLGRIGPAGKKIDRLAVRGPAGTVIAGFVRREPVQVGSVCADEPQVGGALVAFEIGCPQGEHNLSAVRGDLRVGDTLHRQHVMDGEWVGLIGYRRGDPQAQRQQKE